MISSGPVEQTGVYIGERPIVGTDDENVRKVVVRSTDDIFFERQYNPIGKKGGYMSWHMPEMRRVRAMGWRNMWTLKSGKIMTT